MIKRLLLLLSVFIIPICATSQTQFTKSEVKKVMQEVADWQINNFKRYGAANWVNGALYVGMFDWAAMAEELDGDDKYFKFLEKIGQRTGWQPEKNMYHADGSWHASLLDPENFPVPESSGSGFFVYALAYGVNARLLPVDKFLPVIERGWNTLVEAVHEDGKLGYVQPVGASPKSVTRDMTEAYGVGAFLLAGRQIYMMSK